MCSCRMLNSLQRRVQALVSASAIAVVRLWRSFGSQGLARVPHSAREGLLLTMLYCFCCRTASVNQLEVCKRLLYIYAYPCIHIIYTYKYTRTYTDRKSPLARCSSLLPRFSGGAALGAGPRPAAGLQPWVAASRQPLCQSLLGSIGHFIFMQLLITTILLLLSSLFMLLLLLLLLILLLLLLLLLCLRMSGRMFSHKGHTSSHRSHLCRRGPGK